MGTEKIEALLERIALVLERLASRVEAQAGMANSGPIDAAAKASSTGSVLHDPPPASLLERFLDSKGIRIKVRVAEDPADQIIDRLSLYLGERYEALSSLLAKIKRAMQTGAPITESLKGRPQADVGAACQFCTLLHEVAFLEQYQYLRSPVYLIRAKTTTLPRAQRFFGGQWLERFILQEVKAVQTRVAAEVPGLPALEYLVNPQITLPNGDDFELDILAAIGGSIYWIEAKSGDYQQHIAKYSKFARLLGLGVERSFMVLTDLREDRCEALSSLFSMTVCNLRTNEDKLLRIVRADLSEREPKADEVSASRSLQTSENGECA